MAKLRSPIVWFGGKGRMTNKIGPLIPPHHIYVEAFGGGASMLLSKEPSPVEVYNDLDSGLVNFFRVLRDPAKCMKLYMLALLTPHSREEYNRYKAGWDSCSDDIERAYQWFYVARNSFGGMFGGSWGFTVTNSSRGMGGRASAWQSTIDQLAQIHARLMRVQVENNDFRKVIATYDTPDTLFYLDPPYIPETRRDGEYRHELSDEDHRELVDIILRVQGKVLLSGYAHEIYHPLEKAGWKRHDFEVFCTAAGRTRHGKGALQEHKRVDSVWASPHAAMPKRSNVKPKLAKPTIHGCIASERFAA